MLETLRDPSILNRDLGLKAKVFIEETPVKGIEGQAGFFATHRMIGARMVNEGKI